jgi:excisionase family DNA binding protein
LKMETQDPWITVDEMQLILPLSKNKAYDLLSSYPEIKAVRLGRAVRVNKASLLSFVENNPYVRGQS